MLSLQYSKLRVIHNVTTPLVHVSISMNISSGYIVLKRYNRDCIVVGLEVLL